VTRPRKREIKRGATLLSDRDRDQAVAALRESYADGSLTLEEYSRRVDNVLASRTRAQLEPVVKELGRRTRFERQRNATPAPRRALVRRVLVVSAVVAVILVLGLTASRRTNEPRFDRGGVVVGTLDPFPSVPAADVYIVPLDRPAWYADGAFSLLKLQSELSERGLKTVSRRR